MFSDFKFKQPLFYNYMKKAIDNNRLSHAYLIEANGVDYAEDLILSLVKEILGSSNNLDINLLIDQGSYPDFKIIESEEKNIKIKEIRNLVSLFSVKPLYGKYLIYLIKDAEKFNDASANALLKFLEEPSDDVIAILLTKNINSVIDTIVSRCQIFSLVADSDDILSSYFSNSLDYEDFKNEKLGDILELYSNLELNKLDIIGEKETYKMRDDIYLLLIIGLYFYLQLFYLKNNIDKSFDFISCEYLQKILEINTVDDIIKKINVVSEKLKYSNYNLNKDLFIDSLICDICGGYND